MRVRTTLLVAAVLLAGSRADAGLFSAGLFKKKTEDRPRPLDSPIVRPKVDEYHKQGKKAHLAGGKYGSPQWGSQWKQIFRRNEPHFGHYLFDR